jgi:hypothetical protein
LTTRNLPKHDSGAVRRGQPEINAWVVIRPDNAVVVRIARSEKGQGTLTGLAQLVAEELESKTGKNLINPKPVLAGVMLLRCQYTYKAAAVMALSGQVVEAFVMMRSCLEYAGYALTIFKNPMLQKVFMARHFSAEGTSAQKSTFQVSPLSEQSGHALLCRADRLRRF